MPKATAKAKTEVVHVEAHHIKEGMHVLLQGFPCKIRDVNISKPGKHGTCKVRVMGNCILTGKRKEMLFTGDEAADSISHLASVPCQVMDVDASTNTITLLDEQDQTLELDILPRTMIQGNLIQAPASQDLALKFNELSQQHTVSAHVMTVPFQKRMDDAIQHCAVITHWSAAASTVAF